MVEETKEKTKEEIKEKTVENNNNKTVKNNKDTLSYVDVLEARSQRGKPTHQKDFVLKVLNNNKED